MAIAAIAIVLTAEAPLQENHHLNKITGKTPSSKGFFYLLTCWLTHSLTKPPPGRPFGGPSRLLSSGGDCREVEDRLINVKSISATHRAFGAILGDGSLVTWGDSYYGGKLGISVVVVFRFFFLGGVVWSRVFCLFLCLFVFWFVCASSFDVFLCWTELKSLP